jgi:hypothetical protein
MSSMAKLLRAQGQDTLEIGIAATVMVWTSRMC